MEPIFTGDKVTTVIVKCVQETSLFFEIFTRKTAVTFPMVARPGAFTYRQGGAKNGRVCLGKGFHVESFNMPVNTPRYGTRKSIYL